MSPETRLLLRIMDEAFDRKAWHGPTLRGALRGLAPEAAAWRPAPDRHCIWDLALHTAYWKYIARRRLVRALGGGDVLFGAAERGSNFPRLPDALGEKEWKRDVAVLVDEHRKLRAVVAEFPPARLTARSAGSTWPNATQIYGVAAHDLYHAGQIQLLKRLQGV